MRAIFMCFIGLATCWDAAARAEETEPEMLRRVELIRMDNEVEHLPASSARETAAPSAARSVEVLVYRPLARSIERQMLLALQMREMQSGRLSDESTKMPRVSELLTPASSIVVPTWMRPGSLGDISLFTPGCASLGYRPTGFLRPDAELRRASYYGMMSRIACEYGIPVALFDAMIIRESRYHPTIVSPKNAFGLTQLMPATAVGLGVDRYSIEGNLRGGARYLRQQLDRFGQYHLALAAYNAGPSRVRGGLVPRIRETQDYVLNVLSNWTRLSGLQRYAAVLPASDVPHHGRLRPPANRRSAPVSTY